MILPAPGIRVGFWKIDETPEELLQMYTLGEHNETIEAMVSARKSHFIASRLLAKEFYPQSEVFKDEFGKPHLIGSNAHISWSHSGNYAALIACENSSTGIDIEQISDRILRIENKFCNKEDKKSIDPGHHAETLLAIWTAKESMFKWYGRKEVDFKLHMSVEPFEWQESGRFFTRFHKGETQARFTMEYEIINHHLATWIVGETENISGELKAK